MSDLDYRSMHRKAAGPGNRAWAFWHRWSRFLIVYMTGVVTGLLMAWMAI